MEEPAFRQAAEQWSDANPRDYRDGIDLADQLQSMEVTAGNNVLQVADFWFQSYMRPPRVEMAFLAHRLATWGGATRINAHESLPWWFGDGGSYVPIQLDRLPAPDAQEAHNSAMLRSAECFAPITVRPDFRTGYGDGTFTLRDEADMSEHVGIARHLRTTVVEVGHCNPATVFLLLLENGQVARVPFGHQAMWVFSLSIVPLLYTIGDRNRLRAVSTDGTPIRPRPNLRPDPSPVRRALDRTMLRIKHESDR